MFHRPQPFLQLTLPRVEKARQRLERLLWTEGEPVEVFMESGDRDGLSIEEAMEADYTPVTLPHHWGRLMRTRWFKLRMPEVTEPGVYLHWLDQGEGTLVLDGVPYYGFDVAHRHVEVPRGCREGYMEGLCHQSGIWHAEARGIDPKGSCLRKACLMHRNEEAWHNLMDLEVLVDLVRDEEKHCLDFGGLHTLGEGHKPKPEVVSPLLRRILRGLDDAVNALDAGGPAAMRERLQAVMEGLKGGDALVKGVLTGHAHIDLVWIWREINAEYKARHTFASMNRLMDLYPEFRFAYSQSASYDAVARTAPSLHAEVKKRVAEGKWEPVGAGYVESDTILACGEALARSFLVGQERFRDLFGESCRLLWLPDVFGYSGCLPQIMRQCGVDRFFTTKLTWSNINLFPYSSFLWRGTDGSEVLSHVTQGLGYNQNAQPSESRRAAEEYRQSDVHDAFLQPTGHGDGGGGVTPEMCERARRLADLSGVPQTGWGRLDAFYEGLEAVRDRLPVYQGELYLEYHRGTATSHGHLKEAFRGLERALMTQEAAYALLGRGPVDGHAWRRLVFSQFHDYIPGSSIWEVYEEGVPELRDLAVRALAGTGDALGAGAVPVNLLGMPRRMTTREGEVVELPPLSAVRMEEARAVPAGRAPKVERLALACGRVAAVFTQRGEVERLEVDGRTIPFTAPANALTLYPDHPHKYDAWDIDRQTLHLGAAVETPAEPVAWTPERGVGLAFARRIGEHSSVEIRYAIDPAHPVLQVELALDWREEDCLLKACFPTAHRGRFARFGSPYNSVLRSQHPGDPRDEAMFETCMSRWMTVMDDGQSEGMSLVTENKYGVSCREGTVGLSLVRSVRVTGEKPGGHPAIVDELREGGARQPFTDQGAHTLRYAIAPWRSDTPRVEQAAALADQLFMPMPFAEAPADAGLRGLSGGESLIPAWCKPLENGDWILRLHEVLGRAGEVELNLAGGWSVVRTDLSETPGESTAGPVAFRPYEIVSLRMKRRARR